MIDEFQAGDRFYYNDDARHQGVVLKVNRLAGTVEVTYDIGVLGVKQTYVLGTHKIVRIGPAKDPETTKAEPKVDESAVTRKLLNELYHDRARLERVVSDAVGVMEAALKYISKDDDYLVTQRGRTMTEAEASSFVQGLLQQFVDIHRNG